ncbi:hypothetical protein LSAT2_002415, partial [Lamellibrachia satsuma]
LSRSLGRHRWIRLATAPVSVLSTSSKLVRRALLRCLSGIIEDIRAVEQTGFRPKLTAHTEAEFQRRLNTCTVLVNMSLVCDIIWKQGLVTLSLLCHQLLPDKLTSVGFDS